MEELSHHDCVAKVQGKHGRLVVELAASDGFVGDLASERYLGLTLEEAVTPTHISVSFYPAHRCTERGAQGRGHVGQNPNRSDRRSP